MELEFHVLSIIRENGGKIGKHDFHRAIEKAGKMIELKRAFRVLEKDGYIAETGSGEFTLTKSGREKYNELLKDAKGRKHNTIQTIASVASIAVGVATIIVSVLLARSC